MKILLNYVKYEYVYPLIDLFCKLLKIAFKYKIGTKLHCINLL